MWFRSSNPTIRNLNKEVNANGSTKNGEVYHSGNVSSDDVASYKGIGLKALYFAFLVLVVAVLSATYLPRLLVQDVRIGYYIIIGAFIGIIVFGIIASFSRRVALWGTIYAICQAVLIGYISAIFLAI